MNTFFKLFVKISKIKKIKLFLFSAILLIGLITLSNIIIELKTQGKTYANVKAIKHNKVGLVLGTSKILRNGNINLYFKYRVKAVVKLYKNGKIDVILVSGDNSNKAYDEPTDFKNELIKLGIPAHKIYLDYAGFRTLDSVIRAKAIFGQTSITIISQEFHNERAIYIAQNNGIDAVGFNAKDISGRLGLKVKLREYLARTKVFIDILFQVQPKFLGKEIKI